MNFDPNDPRLTAYVLNELTDAERAEVEALLTANPEAAAFVAELRTTTGLLATSLAAEPELTLDSARRAGIAAAAETQPAGRIVAFPWGRTLAGFGAAAAALVLAVVGLQMQRVNDSRSSSSEQQIVTGIVEEQPADAARGAATTQAAIKDDRLTASPPEAMFDIAGLEVMAEPPMEQQALDDALASASPAPAAEPASPVLASTRAVGFAAKGIVGSQFAERRRQERDTATAIISPSQDDFDVIRENGFQRVGDHPLSTFSIDVDTASYAVVRKMLNDGFRPPRDAVRIEELINYFTYDDPAPVDGRPFATRLEAMPAPWNPRHPLVRIGIKGKVIDRAERPPLNLVYLLDVSGSMNDPNKLPLVKRSLQALVNQLDARDRVAIVVYAGAAGRVLPPTPGDQGPAILDAIERLEAGGSTAGGAGIELAYRTAREHFQSNAVNRVILCTDGDFNVGTVQRGDLEAMIEREAKSGVFLTVLGFGMGNYKDSTLELLSNKGNGNYAYIDDFNEARKVLVDQMLGTMVTIAKDVKIQVEFNPAVVAAYRLIGYENRMLKKEDFNNDKVDAGEIGAGHTVTALYELIPVGQPLPDVPAVDALKYQVPASPAAPGAEALTVKMRYKLPDGETSSKLEFPLSADALGNSTPSDDVRFAAAVAGFGMLLRESEHRGSFTYADVLRLAGSALGPDRLGYRAEFLKLVRNAEAITGRK
jgi:Ca-activated chloride channel family protein